MPTHLSAARRGRQTAAGPVLLLLALPVMLDAVSARLYTARPERHLQRQDRGSVTLEQVAIAAGLLAVAIAAVAVIGKAVTNYTDLLQ